MGTLVGLILFLIAQSEEFTLQSPKQSNVHLILPNSKSGLSPSDVIPDEIRVVVGMNSTIVWKNDDSIDHTVEIFPPIDVISEERFHLIEAGSIFSYSFDRAGVLKYVIWPGINGYSDNFNGKVIVQDLNYRPPSQRIFLPYQDEPKYAQITDLAPNSAISFTYPYTGNKTTDENALNRWILLRVSEQYGGNRDDISSFRAYSMVDLHLWCMINYRPEKQLLIDPCHGTMYEPLTGIALSGPGKDFAFKNNALPRLDLAVDEEGYIYIKSPVFSVDKNGLVGYGRKVSAAATLEAMSRAQELARETPTQEMFEECRTQGIPENVCSAEQILAKKRLIAIDFGLEPEEAGGEFITLKKGETRIIPFNLFAPLNEQLNLTFGIDSPDTPGILPEGLVTSLDKTEMFLPAEEDEQTTVRGKVTLTITADPSMKEGKYEIAIYAESDDGGGTGRYLGRVLHLEVQ